MKKIFFCDVTDEEFQMFSDYVLNKVVDIPKNPPLGIEPRNRHNEERIDNIKDAIRRYMDAGIKVPESWREELLDLFEVENKRLLNKMKG